MNNRAIFRAYAQSKGKEAVEFVKFDKEDYFAGCQYMLTKNSKGETERTIVDFREMLFWVMRTYRLEQKP